MKIQRRKLFYNLQETLFIDYNSELIFEERTAVNLYHILKITSKNSTEKIYIAPGNHQGINLTTKIIDLLDPIPVFIPRIKSLRIPGIALPRGNNIYANPSSKNEQTYQVFRNTINKSNFRFINPQSKIDLIFILFLEFLAIFALAITAIIPVQQFINHYQLNDLEYIEWTFVILAPVFLITLLLQLLCLGLIGLFNQPLFYQTDRNFIIEYHVPFISNYQIKISKALNPQFVIKDSSFRQRNKYLVLELRNENNEIYFNYKIGKLFT